MKKLLLAIAPLFPLLSQPASAADCRKLAFCVNNNAKSALRVEYSESGDCTGTNVKSAPKTLRYTEMAVIPLAKRSGPVTICVRKMSPDGRYTVGFDTFPGFRTFCKKPTDEGKSPSVVCPSFVNFSTDGSIHVVDNPDYQAEEPL